MNIVIKAIAADYYVDTVVSSNDTGFSSQSFPWQTITYLLSRIVGNGHTLYVAAGCYNTDLSRKLNVLMNDCISLKRVKIGVSTTNTIII